MQICQYSIMHNVNWKSICPAFFTTQYFFFNHIYLYHIVSWFWAVLDVFIPASQLFLVYIMLTCIVHHLKEMSFPSNYNQTNWGNWSVGAPGAHSLRFPRAFHKWVLALLLFWSAIIRGYYQHYILIIWLLMVFVVMRCVSTFQQLTLVSTMLS